MFGLERSDIDAIVEILRRHREIEKALIFGSRAKGSFKNGSDVDIALEGNAVTDGIASHVGSLLNDETMMPYKFDVLNFNTITNPDLVDHIHRVGIVFYERV